jgi:hypothetical protein
VPHLACPVAYRHPPGQPAHRTATKQATAPVPPTLRPWPPPDRPCPSRGVRHSATA